MKETRDRLALAVVAAVFLAGSFYPVMRERRYADFGCIEILQLRKMLDYGFAKTYGIVPHNESALGRLAHPERVNYTHHPLPRNWVYAGLYHFFGGFGVMLFNVGLGLVQSLIVFAALRRRFDRAASLMASALYACAPALQFWAVGGSPIVLMILVWPIAAWLIWSADGQPGFRTCFWLGLTVFLAGQVSWSLQALVPPLLLMSGRAGGNWKDALRQNLHNPFWRAILVGAALTALVFLVQVIVFTADLAEPFKYAAGFAAAGKWPKLVVTCLLRTVAVVGPALVVGALLGARTGLRPMRLFSTETAMTAFLLMFVLGTMLVPFFFTWEKWPAAWLLFPTACLTAAGLAASRNRVVGWGLTVLVIPGVLYVEVTAGMPKLSRTTQTLASYLSQQTNPEDLILTDLQLQAFPFPYWNEFGPGQLADRLVFDGVTLATQLDYRRGQFRGQVARVLYLHQNGAQTGEALLTKVRQEGRLLQRIELPVPAEVEAPTRFLRPIYWWRQSIGLGVLGESNANRTTRRAVGLELYQLDWDAS